MPEPMYGISREQHRKDMPATRFDSLDTGATVRPFDALTAFVIVGFVACVLFGVALVKHVFDGDSQPAPTPPSREASLERQVGALSTRVVELEWRNASTLAALAGFEPVPTAAPPTWKYIGPYTATYDATNSHNGNAR